MLHVVDLNLIRAVRRHRPDGTPVDAQEVHRLTLVARRRARLRRALAAGLARLRPARAAHRSGTRTGPGDARPCT